MLLSKASTKRSNKVKQKQLGMDYGTATNRLKKRLLFDFAIKLNMQWCFRCGAEIKNLRDFSLDHKIPWLHNKEPKKLFWDLDNIAFSHLSCNSRDSRGGPMQKRKPCPTLAAYDRGCRCGPCRKLKSDKDKEYYIKRKLKNTNNNI